MIQNLELMNTSSKTDNILTTQLKNDLSLSTTRISRVRFHRFFSVMSRRRLARGAWGNVPAPTPHFDPICSRIALIFFYLFSKLFSLFPIFDTNCLKFAPFITNVNNFGVRVIQLDSFAWKYRLLWSSGQYSALSLRRPVFDSQLRNVFIFFNVSTFIGCNECYQRTVFKFQIPIFLFCLEPKLSLTLVLGRIWYQIALNSGIMTAKQKNGNILNRKGKKLQSCTPA